MQYTRNAATPDGPPRGSARLELPAHAEAVPDGQQGPRDARVSRRKGGEVAEGLRGAVPPGVDHPAIKEEVVKDDGAAGAHEPQAELVVVAVRALVGVHEG